MTDAPTAWAALGSLARESAGELALDIGANIGQATKVMAPWFTHVFAFEPCDESFAVLAQECPKNVVPSRVAVSDHAGDTLLDVAEQAFGWGQLVTFNEAHREWGARISSQRVECTTVDDEVRATGVLPNLIKVDTEGHEPWVLTGAEATIKVGFTNWFIEVHHRDHLPCIEVAFTDCAVKYDLQRIDHDLLIGNERGKDHFYMVVRPQWRL